MKTNLEEFAHAVKAIALLDSDLLLPLEPLLESFFKEVLSNSDFFIFKFSMLPNFALYYSGLEISLIELECINLCSNCM